MANGTRGRTLGDVLVEHWVWPAVLAVLGLGVAISGTWKDGFGGFVDAVSNKDAKAVAVVWIVASILGVLALAAALLHQRREGRGEGRAIGREEAITECAAKIKNSQDAHGREMARLRDGHETAERLRRTFYESNVTCCVHLVVRGGVIKATLKDDGKATAQFELQLFGTREETQYVKIHSVHFHVERRGEWFKKAYENAPTPLTPGDWNFGGPQEASPEDVQRIGEAQSERVVSGGEGFQNVYYGTVYVWLSVGLNASNLGKPQPVTCPSVLLLSYETPSRPDRRG